MGNVDLPNAGTSPLFLFSTQNTLALCATWQENIEAEILCVQGMCWEYMMQLVAWSHLGPTALPKQKYQYLGCCKLSAAPSLFSYDAISS